MRDFQAGRQPAWCAATPASSAASSPARTASGCSRRRASSSAEMASRSACGGMLRLKMGTWDHGVALSHRLGSVAVAQS